MIGNVVCHHVSWSGQRVRHPGLHLNVVGNARGGYELLVGHQSRVRLKVIAGEVGPVGHFFEFRRHARYNLLATPGLVINEKLVSAGRIPNQVEVMAWVANALAVA